MGHIRSNLPPFAMVPEWLIYEPRASHLSIRIFATLHRHEGQDGAFPSVARLAKILSVSEDTIKRGMRELVEVKAVRIERRFDAEGRQSSNRYLLLFTQESPGGGADLLPPEGMQNSIPTRGMTDAPLTKAPLNESTNEPEERTSFSPRETQERMGVQEMTNLVLSKLGQYAHDGNTIEEAELFGEDYAGQVDVVSKAISECRRNGQKPVPGNLRRIIGAWTAPAAVPVEKGLRDGGTTIQTPRDLELSNRAKAIVAADRPSAASEDRPVINWHVALEQARKELA